MIAKKKTEPDEEKSKAIGRQAMVDEAPDLPAEVEGLASGGIVEAPPGGYGLLGEQSFPSFVPLPDDLPYTIGDWRGHKNYQCKRCDFAVIGETDAPFRAHMTSCFKCAPPAPPKPWTPTGAILDGSGKPIVAAADAAAEPEEEEN